MKLNLQDNVSSTQDFKSVIIDVRKYAHWFAQNSVKLQRVGGAPSEPPVISQSAVTLIKEWADAKPLSQNLLDELISQLEALEAAAPRVIITLAAVPSKSLKKEMVAWFRANIAANVLVDFHFNSTLLGGMVVRYGSHIYDWSFRRQVLAARDRFPEVLRRV